jgi:hypothetical protein
VNKSGRVLISVETDVLNKGLKFGIKNRKVDSYEMLARFKVLAQTMNKFKIAKKGEELKANLDSKNAFFQQLQAMSTEFIELSKRSNDSVTDEQNTAHKELAREKTIVVTKSDKGNAVVI